MRLSGLSQTSIAKLYGFNLSYLYEGTDFYKCTFS